MPTDDLAALTLFCPCCDGTLIVPVAEPVCPGYMVRAVCPDCGTKFRVEMRYEIVEDADGKAKA